MFSLNYQELKSIMNLIPDKIYAMDVNPSVLGNIIVDDVSGALQKKFRYISISDREFKSNDASIHVLCFNKNDITIKIKSSSSRTPKLNENNNNNKISQVKTTNRMTECFQSNNKIKNLAYIIHDMRNLQLSINSLLKSFDKTDDQIAFSWLKSANNKLCDLLAEVGKVHVQVDPNWSKEFKISEVVSTLGKYFVVDVINSMKEPQTDTDIRQQYFHPLLKTLKYKNTIGKLNPDQLATIMHLMMKKEKIESNEKIPKIVIVYNEKIEETLKRKENN